MNVDKLSWTCVYEKYYNKDLKAYYLSFIQEKEELSKLQLSFDVIHWIG